MTVWGVSAGAAAVYSTATDTVSNSALRTRWWAPVACASARFRRRFPPTATPLTCASRVTSSAAADATVLCQPTALTRQRAACMRGTGPADSAFARVPSRPSLRWSTGWPSARVHGGPTVFLGRAARALQNARRASALASPTAQSATGSMAPMVSVPRGAVQGRMQTSRTSDARHAQPNATVAAPPRTTSRRALRTRTDDAVCMFTTLQTVDVWRRAATGGLN
jgi:hypothetical protein